MAKKKRKKAAGHFQSMPWTTVEAESLFASNKSFRGLAMRAARNLARIAAKANLPAAEPTLDTAQNLARDAVVLSKQIGVATSRTDKEGKGKYPHPALILEFWADFKPKGGSGRVARPDWIGSYLTNFKGTAMEASVWAAFTKAVTTAGSTNAAHFDTTRIHKLVSKSSGVHNGFRLTEIVVRIPVGNRLSVTGKSGSGRPLTAPATFETRTINLLSPDLREKLGDVWLGMTSDKRSMYIASSKVSRIKLSDLVAAGSPGRGAVNGSISTLHPAAAKIKGQLPDSIRAALARAKHNKETNASIIDRSA